ncbi:MAG: pyridoxamine 5'-phosphate oxidase family protein [Spirochaetaceae bacterium]
MRRNEKEITNQDDIIQLLDSSFVGRLAMSNEGVPYVVPVNYSNKGISIFFHSAKEGKKIECLRKNPQVCFEVDFSGEIITGEDACAWSIEYGSVIGHGKARFLEDAEEKREALDLIMGRAVQSLEQSGKAKDGKVKESSGKAGKNLPKSFTYSDSAIAGVAVVRIDLDTVTGKRSGL